MHVEFLTQQNYHKTSPNSGIQKLRSQILKKKALVVFEKNKFIGIISVKDLAKNSFSRVIDCITEKQSIEYNCELNDALDIMINMDIDVLPVWKENKLLGIVFKNDIIEYLKAHSVELESKIKDRTDQLENALKKARESEQLKSSFLANLSHEIRTPLNGILGFSNLLSTKELSGKSVKFYAQIINKSSKQLFSIIDSVLLMSKLEARVLELLYKELNLNKLLYDIFDFFKLQTDKLGLELKLTKGLEDNKCTILADEVRLRQIIDNLLNNALKFTNNGFIEFGYCIENSEIKFYVRDTGIGIKKEFHSKIFERFHQVEIDYLKNLNGMGLGLSISKGLVEMMGGKLSLRSEYGSGSDFYFAIPFLPTEHSTKINADTNKSSKKNLAKDIHDGSFLIVDDEPTNLLFLEELLNDFRVVKLYKARNGQEAYDLCKDNKSIKLVLMDLKMPIMDGFEATRRIRKMRPEIIIIAQSAYNSIEDITAAKEAGCNEFISKPIHSYELFPMINRILSK